MPYFDPGDLELYSIILLFFSSGRMVYTRYFEGLNVAACRFSVMICHFAWIQSLNVAGYYSFNFLYKILNISLTAGFQNVHPR